MVPESMPSLDRDGSVALGEWAVARMRLHWLHPGAPRIAHADGRESEAAGCGRLVPINDGEAGDGGLLAEV